MVNTFLKVYPVLSKVYNSSTAKEVTFVIDTADKGVAATGAAMTLPELWETYILSPAL